MKPHLHETNNRGVSERAGQIMVILVDNPDIQRLLFIFSCPFLEGKVEKIIT